MEIIQLWPTMESAGTGNPADDFAPYLETHLIEDDAAPRGAVLVCPGGGYCWRAPHEATPIAKKFNELGFHAFVVYYRVAPYRHPAPLRDALRAIRIIRSRAAEWKVNGDQIAILGFSAGGHLTASAGTLYETVNVDAGDAADNYPVRPDALIPCYAVINLTSPFGHAGSGENLLGTKFSLPSAEEFNLENQVSANTPPTFLWHTADDPVVNIQNSIAFATALWQHKVTAELHVFPHGPHGIGLAEEYPDAKIWPELAATFLINSCKFAAHR